MSVVAETTAGRIAGTERDGVLRFSGIPFAAPPAGDRRFRAPEPHPGWSQVRDATTFGQVSVQVGDVLGNLVAQVPVDWSEDCLFLNVQTPALDDGGRPVLVWIHGGGFVNGSGSTPWYDGANFVRHGDVVVVSLNYRLGALGWLHLGHLDPAYASSANNGLLDQVAALEWVRDNIAAFGGDPEQVTVFGESAGAMCVGTLLGTPQASGLFHRAVAQSGAAHTVISTDDAAVVTDAVLEELGGGGLDHLLEVAPDRLLEAQTAVTTAMNRGRLGHQRSTGAMLPFSPVVDGAVLPGPPEAAVRRGDAAAVALLVGTNRDEWNLFSLGAAPVTDEATLRRRLGRVLADPDAVLEPYRAGRPGATPQEIFNAVMTDRVFRIPAVRLAEAQLPHRPDDTFCYRFDVATPIFGGVLGACHALEIPYVFDNLAKGGVALFAGRDAPQPVADAMHAAWLGFARGGSPGHGGTGPWPPYDTGRRATVVFDRPCRLEDDPDGAERAAWDGLV